MNKSSSVNVDAVLSSALRTRSANCSSDEASNGERSFRFRLNSLLAFVKTPPVALPALLLTIAAFGVSSTSTAVAARVVPGAHAVAMVDSRAAGFSRQITLSGATLNNHGEVAFQSFATAIDSTWITTL